MLVMLLPACAGLQHQDIKYGTGTATIPGYPELTTPTSDDIFLIVDNPFSSPIYKYISWANILLNVPKDSTKLTVSSGAHSALPGTCTAPQVYYSTDTKVYSYCTNTNTWTDMGLASYIDPNGSRSTLSISSGAITVTNSWHLVDTEGGASTDNLDTINGGTSGRVLILSTVSSARAVIVTEAGNIYCGGNSITLDSVDRVLMFVYNSGSSKWDLAGSSTALTDSTSTTSSAIGASATAAKAAYDHANQINFSGTIAAAGDATNFPAATLGQIYRVTSSGWLGGGVGVGVYVNTGDTMTCVVATSAGGTKAQVYSDWNIKNAVISQPDGYRTIELASNTSLLQSLTNGFYFLNTILEIVQNSTSYSAVLAPAAGQITIAGPTAPHVMTVPDAAFTVARTDAGNTFTGINQTAGMSYATTSSTTTDTGNVNIDGAAYSDYNYTWETNGTGKTYTPFITSAPASGYVRYVTLVFGSASTTATLTLTWTNVDAIGTALGTSVTAGKKSQYACKIPSSGHARCSIVAENY